MKIKLILIVFIITLSSFSQKKESSEIRTIEDAVNKSVEEFRKEINDDTTTIIISFEYDYKKNFLNLSKNDFVKATEYQFDNLRKGDSVFLLKIIIDIREKINIYTQPYKLTKKTKKHSILTSFAANNKTYTLVN